MNMPLITIFYGEALVALGAISYVMTGAQHPTALIPAAFGFVLSSLGMIARKKENLRRHLMHVAVLISLLGLIATAKGIPKAIAHFQGIVVERPAAQISMAIMALLSAIYFWLALRSFVHARLLKKGNP